MADYSRYKKQFDALMRVLNRMDTRYYVLSNAQLHNRRDTILHLIRTLRQFAVGQFYFFYHGFSDGKGEYPKLNAAISDGKPVEFPPEHVLASILDQIAADITIIQLAADQRQLVSLPGQRDSLLVTNTQLDLLTVGDRLGQMSSWAAVKPERVEDWGVKTVLTYLTDSVKVRIVPYSKVMLLGIPYSCMTDLRKLLSIPHEMGHFLFWYSYMQKRADLKVLDTGWDVRTEDLWLNPREIFYKFIKKPRTEDKLATQQTLSWDEEVFADVYSVLVGGPLAILTAMDAALEHSADAFDDLHSDDVHPTPLIRPVLMVKALSEMTNPPFDRIPRDLPQVKSVKDSLFDLWEQKLQERQVTTGKQQQIMDWNSSLSSDTDKYPVENLVRTAVRALTYVYQSLDQSSVAQWGLSSKKYQSWGTASDLEVLATKMVSEAIDVAPSLDEVRFEPISDELYLEDEPHDRSPELWRKWAIEGKRYFKNMPASEVYAGEFETAMDPKTRPNEPPYWLPVFGAGGWDTSGPCGNPGHPYDSKKT